MDEFEFLDSCADKWERLSPERRTRNQQVVVDVVGTVAAVEGDGFAGWWENIVGCGDSNRDFDRVVESFQLAGLDGFADVIVGTKFCGPIVTRAVADEADEFEFAPEQERKLDEADR